MSALGIVTLPEAGHINPAEYLRKELVKAGHTVTYIVKPGEEEYYVSRHLPYERLEQRPDAAPLSFVPAAVLVEAVVLDMAILACAYGIPVLKLSATFSQRYESRLPPLTCDLFPDHSESGLVRTARAWQTEHEKLKASPWYTHAKAWAGRQGFPVDWVDDQAAMGITFRLPELTLAPAELDFERDQTDLFYAGPCVDLARDETGRASLDGLRCDRPIAYCCFGTQVQRYESLVERIRLVIEAARLLPQVTFVVSWEGDGFGVLPANVIVMRSAPQLALLRRSAVMLTHGGLNSVKEALCLGVPVIALPFDHDQFGNAARVAFHGYGRKAAWESISATDLASLVSGVLEDAELGRRVRAVSKRFQKALGRKQAVKAFERCWKRSVEFVKRRPVESESPSRTNAEQERELETPQDAGLP